MATIGLDKLFYSKITEGENGDETYETPAQLAKAMTAELSVELAEATLYADDGAAEIVKEFKSGTLSLGVDDIGATAASDLTGAASEVRNPGYEPHHKGRQHHLFHSHHRGDDSAQEQGGRPGQAPLEGRGHRGRQGCIHRHHHELVQAGV